MRLIRRRPYEKRFTGTWEDRIADLFDAGIDFRARSVLDVGCNMGIVAYEVSKKNPEMVHGLDVYRPAVRIARKIFSGVPVKHRFDVVDICNERKLRSCLSPSYDIVLFLSVWHQVQKQAGVQAANRAVGQIAMRCRHAFITRVPYERAENFQEILAPLGFKQVYRSHSTRGTLSPFFAFERSPGSAEATPTDRPLPPKHSL